MTKNPDAIIIGAGIIGCAIAYEMGKRGYKTVNIDKLPAAGFGSTSNSCAIVRFHYSTWDGAAMAFENYAYWKDWTNYIGPVDERGYAQYIECGFVILSLDEAENRHFIRLFEQIGVDYEVWDLDTLHKQIPIIDLRTHFPPRTLEDDAFWDASSPLLAGGLYNPQAGYVNDPQLATTNLMLAAQSVGGTFLFNREVMAIRQANGRVAGVTLENGEKMDAPIVVNAAGPHSFVINRLAGVEHDMRIKTRALRREVHHVPSPNGFHFEKDGYIFSDTGCGIYFRPESGNHILVGSVDPECDAQVWVDDPDAYNTHVTEPLWKTQVYRLAKRIPDLPIPRKSSGVASLYDVSTDWIPIYDQSALPGFYMAVGTSGNQFKNAGGVGHLMAELIQSVENGRHQDTDPLPVKMPYTGVILNSGFYSRLRHINEGSSFTVLG